MATTKELKELAKTMTSDILKSLNKEKDPLTPLIELYIEKELNKIVK
jgi:hypothetical protein